MTNKEAIARFKLLCLGCVHPQQIGYCENNCEYGKALEALEKCEKFGTCKECNEADFCYNRKDACYCLRHNHIMYSDDTCSYFYRGSGDWSEEE